ncbi:MAG: PorV/PorQ family protein [Candidatus Glassbacteria bacterium]|nr:PorV/PorQ family protein [Candidatus Glassbacteria bacterium]
MKLKELKTVMLALLCAALIPAVSWALEAYPDVGYGRVDGYSAVGRRSGEFLSIPVSARSVGLGDAYTAVVDDISAIYYNPAGLAFLSKTEFQFTLVSLPADVRYNYAAAAVPLADGQWVVGGFYGMLSMDPIEETTLLLPNGTGNQVDVYSQVLGGAVAYNFSDRFSVGISVKHVYEDYWGVNAQAVAFDLGTNYHTEFLGRDFKLGLAILNLGTDLKFTGSRLQTIVDPAEIPQEQEQSGYVNRDPRPQRELEYRTYGYTLPTVFKIGASMVMASSERASWLVGLDLMQPNNVPVSWALGTEVSAIFSEDLTGAFRFGWRVQTDQDEDNLGGSDLYGGGTSARGLSFGGGLHRNFSMFNLGFDYAYRNMGHLSANQFFGFKVGF